MQIGKYYLVDARYPMKRGIFKSYSDMKYDIPDFQQKSQHENGSQETFNKRYYSLRGVI